jgi:tetratricopeptide (TPR) repeat protein
MTLYKSDPSAAAACFKRASSAAKGKDGLPIKIELLSAYSELGAPEYAELLEKLKKDNSDSAPLYVAEGDALLNQKKYGDALGAYAQAVYFDKQCAEAYIRSASVYRNMDLNLAIEQMNNLLAAQPDCDLAYHQLGDLYYKAGKFGDAERCFRKFAERNPQLTKTDLAHYATILFYNKKYDEASALLDQGLAAHPDDQVLNRVKMYILAATTDDDAAASAYMKRYPAESYIALDYANYARLEKKLKHYAPAVEAMEKAVALDADEAAYVAELADLYAADNRYKESLATYEKLFANHPKEVKASDCLAYGKANYYAVDAFKHSADSVLCPALLQKADTLFSQVIERSPDNYLGYFWRARTRSLVDAETTQGLAKPDYERVIAILEPEGKEKAKLCECYNYLGYFYYVAQNNPASLDCWKKTLALDPANEMARKAVEGIK